jgi:hypothetical protein
MAWKTTIKIIEALATIKTDTANHKDDLNEFKNNFDRHIEKEERETIAANTKIDLIQKCLSAFKCPNYEDIKTIERRFHDMQKVHERRRVLDVEERAKEKAIEAKARAEKDEEIAKALSSLKTTRKYNYMSSSGLYVVVGVILKKLFT